MTTPKAPWLKYFGDIPATLEYPQGSMYEAIKNGCENNINNNGGFKNTAYVFQGKKTNYHEFFNKIDTTAKAFKAIGIGKGDKVTICMPNAPQGVDAFYALNRISAVPAMIHPLSAEGEIKFYVTNSNSKAVKSLPFTTIINTSISVTMKSTRNAGLPCFGLTYKSGKR